MAKNRRHQSAAARFGPVLKVVVLCGLIAGSAAGYVWQKDQLVSLSRRKAGLEARLVALRNACKNELSTLDHLQSPAEIEEAIKRHKLGLTMVQAGEVVRLNEFPSTNGDWTGIPEPAPGTGSVARR